MQQVETQAINQESNARISVFVISFNRQAVIGACLAPLSFADELIVVDKSSTDRTAEIAAQYSHRVITVPWSPVVEDTRAFALSRCSHEWILCLDDDECLSAEAVAFIRQELRAPRADIYGIAQRHWILGVHDERAYYWPEFQPRLFRRGAVSFVRTVHSGYVFHSERRYDVPPEGGVCVHHLSHRNVTEWITKTNPIRRYRIGCALLILAMISLLLRMNGSTSGAAERVTQPQTATRSQWPCCGPYTTLSTG